MLNLFGPSARQIQLDRIEMALRRIERMLSTHLPQIERKQAMADYTLDDILANVAATENEVDSLVTLMAGMKTRLDEALVGEPISPAGKAKVNKIFAEIQETREKVSAALLANTPSGPVVEPAPDPAPVDNGPSGPAPVGSIDTGTNTDGEQPSTQSM